MCVIPPLALSMCIRVDTRENVRPVEIVHDRTMKHKPKHKCCNGSFNMRALLKTFVPKNKPGSFTSMSFLIEPIVSPSVIWHSRRHEGIMQSLALSSVVQVQQLEGPVTSMLQQEEDDWRSESVGVLHAQGVRATRLPVIIR